MLCSPPEGNKATAPTLELEAMRRGPTGEARRRIADKTNRRLPEHVNRDVKPVLRQSGANDAGGWLDGQHRIQFMVLHEPTMRIANHGWTSTICAFL
jgi:hypothetical protein